MKKILLILLVLAGLLVAGAGIFLATFNADRYRPRLVAKMEEALHRPVRLEQLRVGWRNGIAIQLRGLSILESASTPPPEPLLSVESLDAVVRLGPLLRREVQVASIVMTRPRVHVARDAGGQVNLLGLAAAASPAAAPGHSPAKVGNATLSFQIDVVRIDDGAVRWTDAAAAPAGEVWVRRVDVEVRHIVPGEPMHVDLRAAIGADEQNARLKGSLTLPSATSSGSLEQGVMTLQRLSLERVLPAGPPSQPRLLGTVSAALEGRVPTFDPAQAVRRLSAAGRLQAADLNITDMNVLRVVFERFTMLPGLVDLLESRLPPAYQRKLAPTDTAFAPVDIPFRVEQGALQFDRLELRSDAFELSGSGRIGSDRSLLINAMLRVDAELSAALIGSVKELQGLANANRQLEIPLTLQSRPPYVVPDVNHIGSRLISTTVQDLLGRLLQDAIPSQESRPPAE